MAALTSTRRFEILTTVLAAAEERGGISLADAAALVGLEPSRLEAVLHPLLYLEYRVHPDLVVDESRAFILDEDGWLAIDDGNWLRDVVSVPPTPDRATRLLLAASVIAGSLAAQGKPTPRALESAITKIQSVVGADIVVHVEEPPSLRAVRAGHDGCRTVRFLYLKSGLTDPRERELEPHRVFEKYGHWYVIGRERDERVLKTFRVDRMSDASVTTRPFIPDPDVEVPDGFDLEHMRREVVVRVTEPTLKLLADSYRVDSTTPLGGGRTEVRLSVFGEGHLDSLLLRIGAGAEIVDAPELVERRQRLAASVLARYAAPGIA